MTSRKGREAGARPLKRKVATRQPRKTLVIFCEGERTEPEYLNALKLQPSVRDVAAVDLRVETGQGGFILRARANDIELAVSNPCFELWLILHFQDHAAWLDNR